MRPAARPRRPDRRLSLLGRTAYRPQDADLASELARRASATVQNARSEQRYRMLFERNPLPMWVYDVHTLGFLAVNEAAVRHYGYSREESSPCRSPTSARAARSTR